MFISPEQVIKKIGVKHGAEVADFGAGSGFYAVPLAKAVGAHGKVYAFDVQAEMLEALRSKAREARLMNISTMRADLERERGSGLADGVVDLVLISNILFQAEDKSTLIKEAVRILRVGGELALIDWNTGWTGGPPPERLVSRDAAEKLLENEGLKRIRDFDAGDNHYGLLYSKP